ncbi:MAG: hypothetical protein H0X25_23910 [Acidobacteriales bacterium]|nr:hypothetical protein [Terriglobales bacterium]
MVGRYDTVSGSFYGFELSGSTYAGIKPPNAARSMANGISDAGVIAGSVPRSIHSINFLAKEGTYKKAAIPGVSNPTLEGINPEGTALVGYFSSRDGANSAAFLWRNNATQVLAYPGSSSSAAYGVNSLGVVVGIFYDDLFHIHGFTWTAPTLHEQ